MVLECRPCLGYCLGAWQTWYHCTTFKIPKVYTKSYLYSPFIDVKCARCMMRRLPTIFLLSSSFLCDKYQLYKCFFIIRACVSCGSCLNVEMFELILLVGVFILKIKGSQVHQKWNPKENSLILSSGMLFRSWVNWWKPSLSVERESIGGGCYIKNPWVLKDEISRLHKFKFHWGSKKHCIVEELQKKVVVMHVVDAESVELDAYQLKGESRVWYD